MPLSPVKALYSFREFLFASEYEKRLGRTHGSSCGICNTANALVIARSTITSQAVWATITATSYSPLLCNRWALSSNRDQWRITSARNVFPSLTPIVILASIVLLVFPQVGHGVRSSFSAVASNSVPQLLHFACTAEAFQSRCSKSSRFSRVRWGLDTIDSFFCFRGQSPRCESFDQNSSIIGLVPKSTSGNGLPAGPGRWVSRSNPRLWKMVATTSLGAVGRSAG